MQPKFVELPEMKVIGVGARFISILSPKKNNATVIPKLWDQFIKQIGQISHKTGDVSLGLVEMLPENAGKGPSDELFYIACTAVSEIDSVPPGMIRRVIPAGRYASFTHKGKLTGLEQTMNFIYRSWLPKGEVQLRDAPHLEWYDQRFNPGSDQSEFDILLPVK